MEQKLNKYNIDSIQEGILSNNMEYICQISKNVSQIEEIINQQSLKVQLKEKDTIIVDGAPLFKVYCQE